MKLVLATSTEKVTVRPLAACPRAAQSTWLTAVDWYLRLFMGTPPLFGFVKPVSGLGDLGNSLIEGPLLLAFFIADLRGRVGERVPKGYGAVLVRCACATTRTAR